MPTYYPDTSLWHGDIGRIVGPGTVIDMETAFEIRWEATAHPRYTRKSRIVVIEPTEEELARWMIRELSK
jgi:hypothetical protein